MTRTNQNPSEVVVGLKEAQQLRARESEHKLRVQQLHIMQQQRDQLQRRETQTSDTNGEFPVPQGPSIINPFSGFEKRSAQENSVLSTAGSNQGVSGPSTNMPLPESNQFYPSSIAPVPRPLLPKTNLIQHMSAQEQRFLLAQARAQSNLHSSYKEGEVNPRRQRVWPMDGLNGNDGHPYGNKGSVSYPIQSNSLNNRGDYSEHLLKGQLNIALVEPVEALLDAASDDTWLAIRRLLKHETKTAVSGLASDLSVYDLDQVTVEKMLAKLEEYARNVIESKAREEA